MRARTIPTILFSFLIWGETNSQTKNKERFYPEEYLYPLNELGAGKTYVYKEVGGTQYSYMDIIPIQDSNQSVYVTQHYTSTEKIDSSTFSANWLLHDTYLFLSDTSPTRGKILSDEVIDDGSRLGQHISNVEYLSDDFIFGTVTKSTYAKDSTAQWQDQLLDCIITQDTTWMDISSVTDSSYKSKAITIYIGIFAKGIGLIRYTGGIPDKPQSFQLIAIREIANKEAKQN